MIDNLLFYFDSLARFRLVWISSRKLTTISALWDPKYFIWRTDPCPLFLSHLQNLSISTCLIQCQILKKKTFQMVSPTSFLQRGQLKCLCSLGGACHIYRSPRQGMTETSSRALALPPRPTRWSSMFVCIYGLSKYTPRNRALELTCPDLSPSMETDWPVLNSQGVYKHHWLTKPKVYLLCGIEGELYVHSARVAVI